MNIFVSIAGLAFLILIHEAGHFFVARAVRMRPRKFYVFFPPVLFRKMHNGIEYGLGAIPLGGYVKIPGMHRPAGRDLSAHYSAALDDAPSLRPHVETAAAVLDHEELDEPRALTALADLRSASDGAHLTEHAQSRVDKGLTDVEDALSPEAYWRAPVWKRVAVIAAGPITNLLFAVAMLAVVFALGVPRDANRVVDEVVSGTPAETIGLLSGDEVIAVDGTGVETFDEVSTLIRASAGDPISLTVLRDGSEVVLGPRAAELSDGRYRLGFIPSVQYETYGPAPAVGEAFKETWSVTKAIGNSLANIVTPEGREDIATPIGIVQGSSQILEQGFRDFLAILALISLSLALLNMLPLLPLDGGHILFSLLERVRRRAIPREAYERASTIGIALVLILFVIGLTNDIGRLGG
ncbi:MAG: M50 family metallopeptidase [Gaiellaceae bacterium]